MYRLKDLFLLKGLSEEEKREVISSFPPSVTYKKGAEIYTNDKFDKAMVIILSGRADALDERLLKKSFCEGDSFGVAALFGNEGGYISRIVAKSDCTVLFIDEAMLRQIFTYYPVTAVNYITFLSGKVRFLNRKITLFTCKSVSARLYQYLSENANDKNEIEIDNMSKLARLTSIGRTSLYRAVDELIEGDMIEKSGSKFIIK